MKILALRERFNHMSIHSGYDVLYNYFEKKSDAKIESIFCNHTKMYPRGLGRLLTNLKHLGNGTSFYTAQSFDSELRLLQKAINNKYDIIHYSYGEPYYGLLSGIKKFIKAKIVLTNHQPTSWWNENRQSFKKFLNAPYIIVLSKYDKEYWEENANKDARVFYIPHGVDTNFYKPLPNKEKAERESFNIVFTGRYLRDMDILVDVINKLSCSNYNITFDIIYLHKKQIYHQGLLEIMNFRNVRWHSNVTALQLLKIYQNSDCLLLPLKDCTANNALLEGMACGLPIITSDLPPLRSYTDFSMSTLIPNRDVSYFCDAVIQLYNDPHKKNIMGNNSRKKAITEFCWERVASLTMEAFHQ